MPPFKEQLADHKYTGSMSLCTTCFKKPALHIQECSICGKHFPSNAQCPTCSQPVVQSAVDAYENGTAPKVAVTQAIKKQERDNIIATHNDPRTAQIAAEGYRNSHIEQLKPFRELSGQDASVLRAKTKEFAVKELLANEDWEERAVQYLKEQDRILEETRVKIFEVRTSLAEKRTSEVAKLTPEEQEEYRKGKGSLKISEIKKRREKKAKAAAKADKSTALKVPAGAVAAPKTDAQFKKNEEIIIQNLMKTGLSRELAIAALNGFKGKK